MQRFRPDRLARRERQAPPRKPVQGLLLLLATTWLLCAQAGHAADEPPKSEDGVLKKTLERGHTELGHGDKKAALAAYESAYRRAQRFDTAANLGLLEWELKRLRSAASHLAAALRMQPPKADPVLVGRLQTAYRSAAKGLASFDLQLRAPAGSELLVDDKVRAVVPVRDPVFVKPGRHVIVLRKGSESTRVTYTVASGQRKQVALTLVSNGRQLTQGQALLVFSGTTVAIASVAAGGAMLFGSLQRAGNVDEKREALGSYNGNCAVVPELCLEIANNESARDDLRLGAIVAFSGGAAVGLATAIYGVLATRSDDKEASQVAGRLRLSPVVSPGKIGLHAGWSF